ncbi:MAG TPA: hypothetical protein VHK88_14405 [Aquihabitans sp.]|jgi:hypothetical protein|nr:hypothetical protein [Aquihabitans sp.]
MSRTEWNQSEVLAWSSHDGPGGVPRAPSRWLVGGVAGVLVVTFSGIMASDALCPDHRAWVQGLATVALVTSVVAVAQALRDQASAGVLALFASSLGMAIGLIDAVHSPSRGSLIALAFAVAATGSSIVAFRLLQLGAWDRRIATAHRAGPVEASGGDVTGTPDATVPAAADPEAARVHQPRR